MPRGATGSFGNYEASPEALRAKSDRLRALAADFAAHDADIFRQYADELEAKATETERRQAGQSYGPEEI